MDTKHVRSLFKFSSFFMGLMVIVSLFAFAAPAAAQTPQPVTGAQVNGAYATNCRSGPSTAYTIVSLLNAGQTMPAVGRLNDNSWWQIQNPYGTGGTCWVWGGSTQLIGDPNSVAVVAAPTVAYTSPIYTAPPAYTAPTTPYYAPYYSPYYTAPYPYYYNPGYFYYPGFRHFRRRFLWMP